MGESNPLRQLLQTFFEHVNRAVDGMVKGRPYKGRARLVSVSSLYDSKLAGFGTAPCDVTAPRGLVDPFGLRPDVAEQAKRG